MKKVILIAACLLSIQAAYSQTKTATDKPAAAATTKARVRNFTPDDFEKNMTQKDVQLVDVRTAEEYQEGHIKNAQNIDFLGEHFEAGIAKLDKSKPVYVYCKSGGRSTMAGNRLSDLGFTTIVNLDGGITKWQAKGKPVEQ